MNIIIGSHVRFNKSDQLVGSVKEAISYNANTFMFYTGPTQSTLRYDIDDNISYEAYKLMLDNNIDSNNVIVHSPYIINLANNSDERKYKFYIDFLIDELNRVNTLGFNKLVLHPGSAVNVSRSDGIRNIANGINIAFSSSNDVIILLEFMSGKGNELGTSINELKAIIDLIEDKNRIGVCLDTCHMNDSGIDLKEFDKFLDEFDKEIGIDKIKCIHVNDSINSIGSHKDRHENIGYGTIGFDTLINVIYNSRLNNIPFILETPYINRNSKEETPPYKYEIECIRNKKFTSFK
jgi:deoxyribonuclease IV